jgi:hypothetical protein
LILVKWLYRTRSEGLTCYSCLSVLLPLRVRLGHLSWNNSCGSTTIFSPRDRACPRPQSQNCSRADEQWPTRNMLAWPGSVPNWRAHLGDLLAWPAAADPPSLCEFPEPIFVAGSNFLPSSIFFCNMR